MELEIITFTTVAMLCLAMYFFKREEADRKWWMTRVDYWYEEYKQMQERAIHYLEVSHKVLDTEDRDEIARIIEDFNKKHPLKPVKTCLKCDKRCYGEPWKGEQLCGMCRPIKEGADK